MLFLKDSIHSILLCCVYTCCFCHLFFVNDLHRFWLLGWFTAIFTGALILINTINTVSACKRFNRVGILFRFSFHASIYVNVNGTLYINKFSTCFLHCSWDCVPHWWLFQFSPALSESTASSQPQNGLQRNPCRQLCPLEVIVQSVWHHYGQKN